MSEQIREQVSAFLDGELPNTETELLLKRLTRDGELRESFGRYALIGEALRGAGPHILTRSFASRVNLVIDG
jgi:negative regulator of sigma E activity